MVMKCCNSIFQIKCIDSARFMETSLSNLVDNLPDGIQDTEIKNLLNKI